MVRAHVRSCMTDSLSALCYHCVYMHNHDCYKQSLVVETTALSVLAWLNNETAFVANTEKAIRCVIVATDQCTASSSSMSHSIAERCAAVQCPTDSAQSESKSVAFPIEALNHSLQCYH
jgi:hypothetical protein